MNKPVFLLAGYAPRPCHFEPFVTEGEGSPGASCEIPRALTTHSHFTTSGCPGLATPTSTSRARTGQQWESPGSDASSFHLSSCVACSQKSRQMLKKPQVQKKGGRGEIVGLPKEACHSRREGNMKYSGHFHSNPQHFPEVSE